MTKQQQYLLEYLAVYSYIQVKDLPIMMRSKEYSKRVAAELIKAKLIKKHYLKAKENRADKKSVQIERLRIARKHLENAISKLDNKYQLSKVRSVLKEYAGADWDLAQENSSESYTIYKLTPAGKEYVKSLGYSRSEVTISNHVNMSRVMRIANISSMLRGSILETEVIPKNRKIAASEGRSYFIPSFLAKEMHQDIGQRNRALGVLCGPSISHAVYYDGNGKMQHLYKDEISIANVRLEEDIPLVRDMICFTRSSNNFIDITTKYKTIYASAQKNFMHTHILEYDESGMKAAAIITHHLDWVSFCLKETLPEGEYTREGLSWELADADWHGNSVMVMVTNEVNRMSSLLDQKITLNKLKGKFIICLAAQYEFYSNEEHFPGATVLIMPENNIAWGKTQGGQI